MTILDLKNFLASLPENFNSYSVSFRVIGKMNENGERLEADADADAEGEFFMFDNVIVSAYVDEENNELCFLDSDNFDLYHSIISSNNNNE